MQPALRIVHAVFADANPRVGLHVAAQIVLGRLCRGHLEREVRRLALLPDLVPVAEPVRDPVRDEQVRGRHVRGLALGVVQQQGHGHDGVRIVLVARGQHAELLVHRARLPGVIRRRLAVGTGVVDLRGLRRRHRFRIGRRGRRQGPRPGLDLPRRGRGLKRFLVGHGPQADAPGTAGSSLTQPVRRDGGDSASNTMTPPGDRDSRFARRPCEARDSECPGGSSEGGRRPVTVFLVLADDGGRGRFET